MNIGRPRVLVVDDDAAVREALVDLLVDEGMDVVGAATHGAQAITMAADLAPDIVMMDLRMPGIDGIQATRAIKEEDPSVQVVILSAYDDAALTKGADEAGAYAYLVKGCSAALVRDVVTQAWNLKKGLEERKGA